MKKLLEVLHLFLLVSTETSPPTYKRKRMIMMSPVSIYLLDRGVNKSAKYLVNQWTRFN